MAKPLTSRQKAVGKCPICKKYPTWFNDVPIRAFCWGTKTKKHPYHPDMTCVVPLGDYTPKWMTEGGIPTVYSA